MYMLALFKISLVCCALDNKIDEAGRYVFLLPGKLLHLKDVLAFPTFSPFIPTFTIKYN